jgi:hypothetical protein
MAMSNHQRWTVGSLYGQPQDAQPARVPEPAPAEGGAVAADAEEGQWVIHAGQPAAGGGQGFDARGVERLDYSNPLGQVIERVWFDGKLVFAMEVGEMDIDPTRNKVAQEYQIVSAVELDPQGKLVREPERVPGQFNIYDSIPGMEKYSPVWQFNYVVVPRDYQPNTLRSETDLIFPAFAVLGRLYRPQEQEAEITEFGAR